MKKIIKYIIGKKLFKILKKIIFSRVDELEIIHEYLVKTKSNHGLMIDVGVHYGESCIPFLQDGWEVVGFEPDKNNRLVIDSKIINKSNFTLFDFALSNEKSEMKFYTSQVSTGISSLLNFHESHSFADTVKVETLKNIIEEYEIEKVKILKIDCEGYDFFVLKGFDFEKHHNPEFIICEFEDLKTSKLNYKVNEIIEYLQNYGYLVLVCEWKPIIRYGSNHRFNKAKLYPCDINSNAWGNLIAYKDKKFTQFALNEMN